MDYVSTISRSMMNKAQGEGRRAEKVIFPELVRSGPFRDVTEYDAQALRAELSLPDQKTILYSGNIGEKAGAGERYRAAQQLSEHPWMFVISQSGRRKSASGEDGQ